ncbi:MAG: RNA pyrophosphohydrolase [Steroidobacteraceae bacterium]
MTEQIDAQGFRANVGIVLMHGDGRVFLGRRAGGKGWQFPQGGLQVGESAEEGMYRELAEEIGLEAAHVEIVGVTRRWLRYRLPPRFQRREQLPLCIGQKQRWYLLRARDEQPPFKFDTTAEPEFSEWRWADYWDPVQEVIHFKRRVYERALHELGRLAFPEGLPPYPSWWTRPSR